MDSYDLRKRQRSIKIYGDGPQFRKCPQLVQSWRATFGVPALRRIMQERGESKSRVRLADGIALKFRVMVARRNIA